MQIEFTTQDAIYSIECTGDACVGDEIKFLKAEFTGSFRNPKFDGFVEIKGKIIKDSYGSQKQQHTFTVELLDGSKMLIKGRNLYKYKVFRKSWANESERETVLHEKHSRGKNARFKRNVRQNERYLE
jgi:hypothetical protein